MSFGRERRATAPTSWSSGTWVAVAPIATHGMSSIRLFMVGVYCFFLFHLFIYVFVLFYFFVCILSLPVYDALFLFPYLFILIYVFIYCYLFCVVSLPVNGVFSCPFCFVFIVCVFQVLLLSIHVV